MATLIIPNTYMVSIDGESGGQNVTNVVGITADFKNAQMVAEAVSLAWKFPGGPLSRMSTLYSMRQITVVDLTFADGDVYTLPVTGAGSQVGALATNGSCALVSYSGGTRSRSSSGRLFFGPLTEGAIQSDGRSVENATRTGIDAAFLIFQNQLAAGDYNWCVISRKLAKASVIPIGAAHVQPIIATQRRRIRGR